MQSLFDWRICLLLFSAMLFFVLFLYLQEVLPNEYGVSKHPLYFLDSFKFATMQARSRRESENIAVSPASGSRLEDPVTDVESRPPERVHKRARQNVSCNYLITE